MSLIYHMPWYIYVIDFSLSAFLFEVRVWIWWSDCATQTRGAISAWSVPATLWFGGENGGNDEPDAHKEVDWTDVKHNAKESMCCKRLAAIIAAVVVIIIFSSTRIESCSGGLCAANGTPDHVESTKAAECVEHWIVQYPAKHAWEGMKKWDWSDNLFKSLLAEKNPLYNVALVFESFMTPYFSESIWKGERFFRLWDKFADVLLLWLFP